MTPTRLTALVARSLRWCGMLQNLPFTILIILSLLSLASRLILILK